MLRKQFLVTLFIVTAVPCYAASTFWRQSVNVDDRTTTLVKTAGCDGCADACATSAEAVSGPGGALEIKATEKGANRFVGLTTDPGRFFGQVHRPTATAWQDLDFSLYFIIGGYVEVRERGVYRTDTTYTDGDVFRIAAVDRSIQYFKNGELFYTSAIAPKYPLNAAALLMSKGSTVATPVVIAGGAQ